MDLSSSGHTDYQELFRCRGGGDSFAALQKQYEEETFIHIMAEGQIPHTRHVRGSNYAFISVFEDRLPGRAIVICGEHPLARLQLARSAAPPAVPALPARASLTSLPHQSWHSWQDLHSCTPIYRTGWPFICMM